MASGTWKSATAAAEPDDDPPGVRSGSTGLRVFPGPKKANSVVTVLPRMMAPAAFSSATMKASALGWRPAKIADPNSVGKSLVSMMSLMPTGMPLSGGTGLPLARSASLKRAASRARPASMWAQAATASSRSAILARQAVTRASEVRRPDVNSARASDAVRRSMFFLFMCVASPGCSSTGWPLDASGAAKFQADERLAPPQ